MRRAVLLGVGLVVVLILALSLVPRLRDARVTLHAVFLRFGGPTVGLDREDVEFPSGDQRLSGTLVFPRESRTIAAIVLVHGSGPSTRMLWLAHLFASNGVAALTYDKRGTGQSGGTFVGGLAAATGANLDLLAQDAAAAAAVLSRHPRLKGVPVGYAGLSQGGWVGPMAAVKSPEGDFMIFFSGPVATVCEEAYFSDLAEGDASFWETHTREQVADYMKSVKCQGDDVNPSPTLAGLRIPGFWAFGGADNIMPVDVSVARLDALIAGGQTQFRYRVYPENGHEVIVFDFSHLRLSAAFHDAVDWIRQNVDRAAQQEVVPEQEHRAGGFQYRPRDVAPSTGSNADPSADRRPASSSARGDERGSPAAVDANVRFLQASRRGHG
jgi:alpha/beta superfamily hydrolase